MRTGNSIKNIMVGLLATVVIAFLGFISRKIFIDILGVAYLGLNGLMTNLIGLLALIESGIGTSITFHLYRPLAEGDKKRVVALVQLYKRLYRVLALIIFILGLGLFPFIDLLIKEGQSLSNVSTAYFLFLIQSVMGYFFSYKWSLINADQRGYVLVGIDTIFNIALVISRTLILISFQDYLIFLCVGIFSDLIQHLVKRNIVNKRYPYINTHKNYKLDDHTHSTIVNNIKALFLHNIGTYCVFGTDNILISTFISISTLGLYLNYNLIVGQVGSILNPILTGIGSSVGHLLASESKEKSYYIFRVVNLINFWCYSFGTILLYNLLEPFITWWLGYGYLLNNTSMLIILMNFYLTGMRISINIFKTRGGIFTQDQYMPLVEALINLIASLLLVSYLGLAGIFLGTTISTVLTVFWNAPKLVYTHLFKVSVTSYFKTYFSYLGLMFLVGSVTSLICNYIVQDTSFLALMVRGITCLIVVNFMYIIIFYKTPQFITIRMIVFEALSNFRLKNNCAGQQRPI